MTWTKLGDEFSPETADLTDAAFRLHTLAICWSNWRLLDLVIPHKHLKMFAFIESRTVDDAVEELITEGWWQRIDSDTYWIGCKFAEWQRDKVQVEHLRERKAQDQRRKRRHDLDDHSLCLSGRCKPLSPGDKTGDSPDQGRGDPGRLRNGSVTGTPTTKPSLEEEGIETGTASSNGHRAGGAVRVAGSVAVDEVLSCEACGSTGPTELDAFGRPVCVGRCIQGE